MAYNHVYIGSLNEIADAVICKLTEIKDPFTTPTLVFHNSRVAQWFKAYYLKNKEDVLMGIDFTTLSVFINDLINPDRKYTIMDRETLRIYILKALLNGSSKYAYDSSLKNKETNYIYNKDGTMNGGNIFEFADKLSGLFMDYEMDMAGFSGWEYALYCDALNEAEKDGCSTTKRLFDKNGINKRIENPVIIIDNSYFSDLFNEMLSKADSEMITVYSLPKTEEKNRIVEDVISAPSEKREVEAVHSQICELIQAGLLDHYNDVVVYAPDINHYANAVRSVFLQDNKEYPNIPFTIAGETKLKQDMAASLRILFDIANKRFFTRNDFYKFIKNPIIQYIWKIEDADVNIWMDTLLNTNVHRDSALSDDWDYIKKRLIAGMLVSNNSDISEKVDLNAYSSIPYASIDMDKKRINKLIDIINVLIQWNMLFTDEPGKLIFDANKMEAVRDCLDGMYSKKNEDDDELNYMYIKVSDLMEDLIHMNIQLPGNTLLQLLIDIPETYCVSPSDIFVGGITFIGIKSDDIVSQKYAFVMGMSSEQFPRRDFKGELDMHDSPMSSKELDNASIDRILNNSERTWFSYTNCDLTKDEPYYPSSVILDRIDASKINDDKYIVRISLDEDRPYDQLFTRGEFRNKQYFEDIGREDEYGQGEISNNAETNEASLEPEQKSEDEKNNIDVNSGNIVMLSEIRRFLESSFIYKYSKVMHSVEDQDEDITDEFEPIDMNGLSQYGVIKEMILADCSEAEEKEKIRLEKKIPEDQIGEAYWKCYLDNSASKTRTQLADNYEKLDLDPLELTTISASGENTKWVLKYNGIVWKKSEGNKWRYMEPVDFSLRDLAIKTYLMMYVTSLMDIAGQSEDISYEVVLGPDEKPKSFTINPNEAKEILGKCYLKMMDFEDNKYTDIDFVNTMTSTDKRKKKVQDKAKKSLNGLIEVILDGKGWKYFSDKEMIDPYTQLGYNDKDYASAMQECVFMKELIKFSFK